QDPVCGHARGSGTAEAGVPGVVHKARPRRRWACTRSRLGADGGVLPVPAGTLEASPDVEPGGASVRGGAHRRGQALREGGECVGGELEGVAHRREDVPASRRAGVLADVANGAVYVDGVRAVNRRTEGTAA